ncbi:lipoprotein BA_5634 family protein [Paenibacillus sp. ACRRX]|uniref:lipoprotein BA_5634 family protein n=1 Tax=Paenibacillus sp. ACRRX TaxID=2918206 RepID=UPI001EF5AF62|nr:lipoprotein BA_5634 family protein [Paenibacillus sp. ACRRX]MCG7408537.1 lipoprotein BA_5634 family protein [Paenibacillus sp. ACRRX]
MKRWISTIVLAGLIAILGTGCVFNDKANGIVLYGLQDDVKSTVDNYAKDIKFSGTIPFKDQTTPQGRMLILNENSAKALIEAGIMKQVTEKDKVSKLDTLPTVSGQQGVIFAKQDIKAFTLDGVSFAYGGNNIIGDGRKLVDMFAIVSEEAYKQMKGDVKSLGLLNFGKDISSKLAEFTNLVEAVQLVRFEE